MVVLQVVTVVASVFAGCRLGYVVFVVKVRVRVRVGAKLALVSRSESASEMVWESEWALDELESVPSMASEPEFIVGTVVLRPHISH